MYLEFLFNFKKCSLFLISIHPQNFFKWLDIVVLSRQRGYLQYHIAIAVKVPRFHDNGTG